jgi:hypothetical protein
MFSFSIDAQEELPSYGFGRLINHSATHPNLRPVVDAELERIYFVAKENIPANTQLFYDYADYDPEVLRQPTNAFLRRPAKPIKVLSLNIPYLLLCT